MTRGGEVDGASIEHPPGAVVASRNEVRPGAWLYSVRRCS